MPEFKEKTGPGRCAKARSPSTALPRQAVRQMKEKAIRERKQTVEETEGRSGYAEEQVEEAGHWAVKELARTAAPTKQPRKPGPHTQEEPSAGQADMQTDNNAVSRLRREPVPREHPSPSRPDTPVGPRPGQRQTAGTPSIPSYSGRDGLLPDQFPLHNRRTGAAASHQAGNNGGREAAEISFCSRSSMVHPPVIVLAAPPSRSCSQASGPRLGGARSGTLMRTAVPPAPSVPRMAADPAKQYLRRQNIQTIRKAGKGVFALTKKLSAAVVRAVSALVSSLISLVGGSVLLVAVIIIIVIGAVASSPFGLFFAQERNAPGTLSVSEAVNEVNIDYNSRLENLQAGEYDDIVIQGHAADWPDVLAVFAVRFAGADDGVDVATLDADRVEKLTAVFWDMTEISSWVETIEHPGSGDSGGWTEYILHIVITAKTSDDMRTVYTFTDYQNSALDELLADRAALSSLAGSLSITNAEARAVLDALPEDLAPERRAVVETALTLYGKVTYFWGGKSLVLGWDNRWGQLTKVTAAGSPTTGTYRPYGLDCSGMVDWVFYNVTGGEYIIGHGGGAHAQHTYCDRISWDEAQPGDLVFYPEDEHVGIVCGADESNGLLVIHCSSGANNVVITGTSGFTSVARPFFYNE